MKRLSLILMASAFTCAVSLVSNAQLVIQIGDSVGTNTVSTYPCPYGNSFDDSRHQMLFRASELNAAGMTSGDITSIALWVINTNNEELDDYRIEMGLTTDTALGAQFIQGLTPVWGPQDFTNQNGWNTHQFSTSFFWDGVSNIVVQTCNNNPNNSDNPIMVNTSTGFVSTSWDLTNQGNICGGGPGGGPQPSDFSMDRPVVRFGLNPAFAAPITDFAPQSLNTCSNTIQFQDLSLFDPTSWLWNFGDGTTDTLQNPLHTYASDGSYTVTLIAINALGSDTLISQGQITTNGSLPQPQTACIPYTTNTLAGFGITDITFANSSFQSADGASENYVDSSCLLDTVTQGSIMSVSINTASAAPHNIRLWVDWNNSGVFEASEEELAQNSVFSAMASIPVPGNAITNTPLRMRVVADFQLSPIPSPCGDPQYGQAEDYGLVVLVNTQVPSTSFTSDLQSTCNGVVNFSDQSLNVPTSWIWNFGDGMTSTAQNPTHTYTSSGTYSVQLMAFNGFGSDTLIQNNYITVNLAGQLTPASCTPQTQTVLGDYGIFSVDLGSISSVSPGAIEGYQDRSCEFSTTIQEGTNSLISIGTGVQNNHDVYIWLDLNNDGAFSNAELIWTALGVTNPSSNLAIPFGAVYNTPLRLRISADALGNITSACDDPAFGQTEDFAVIVTQNTNPPTANFDADATTVCAGEAVQFNDLSINLPATWNWDFGDGNSSNNQNPIHTYLTAGNYSVSLSVTNTNGSDGATLTNYIQVIDSTLCDTADLNFFNSPLMLTSCGGVVVDDGGPNGNYSQFGQGLVSIQPTTGDFVILTFAQFELRNQDDLIVYDGPDDNSPVIGTYSGNTLPNGGVIISSGPSISFALDVGGGGGGGGGFQDGFIINYSCSFVGVPELSALEMSVYPNPVSDILNVHVPGLEGKSTLNIIDPLGKVVRSKTTTFNEGQGFIDVSGLEPGTYLVLLPTSANPVAQRIVIK